MQCWKILQGREFRRPRVRAEEGSGKALLRYRIREVISAAVPGVSLLSRQSSRYGLPEAEMVEAQQGGQVTKWGVVRCGF